jgi:glycosyltransferase involved in cell wall biosynthesis
MKMLPPELVSVIIPVFNDVAGIARTIEGIALQSWPEDRIEVIVVDNGSEQPVIFSVQYPFPVRVIRCETPGSYAARNAGAAVAKGEVLVFTDADCIPCESWLERGIASLIMGEGKWAVGGEVLFSSIESPSSVALYQMTTGFGQESNVRDKGFSATANLFCTRAQFDKVGPFDQRLLSGGDREWAWRASTLGISINYQPDAIVYTEPRRTLRDAIRQARRVVAGRAGLRKFEVAHIGDAAVAKQRSALESVRWILSQSELSLWDRTRVLAVAILIRCAVGVERIRLALGAAPERR